MREPITTLIRSLVHCFTDSSLNEHWYDAFTDAGNVFYCWLRPSSEANQRSILD